jgi:hypothetical protein
MIVFLKDNKKEFSLISLASLFSIMENRVWLFQPAPLLFFKGDIGVHIFFKSAEGSSQIQMHSQGIVYLFPNAIPVNKSNSLFKSLFRNRPYLMSKDEEN